MLFKSKWDSPPRYANTPYFVVILIFYYFRKQMEAFAVDPFNVLGKMMWQELGNQNGTDDNIFSKLPCLYLFLCPFTYTQQ